jgi:MYXO-CTERM domain-containing protein
MARREVTQVKTRFSSALTLAALFSSLSTLAPGAHAEEADYEKVSNALAGVTHLMRNDDLVVTTGNELIGAPGFRRDYLSSISMSDSSGAQSYTSFCTPRDTCTLSYDIQDYEQALTAGRFFRLPQDSVIEYPSIYNVTHPAGDNGFDIMVGKLDGTRGTLRMSTHQILPYGTNESTRSQAAVADFNGDGFDDLLMVYSDFAWAFGGNGRARIGTAANIDNPEFRFTFGPETNLGFEYGGRGVATGDFNGDGRPDFAVLYVDSDQLLNVAVYSVDAALTAHKEASVKLDTIRQLPPEEPMQLVAGSFGRGGNQQLVVAHRSGDKYTAKLHVLDFGADFRMQEKATLDTGIPINRLKMVADRFSWSASRDSVALMLTNVADGNSTSQVQIYTVNPTTYALSSADSIDVPRDIYNTSNKNYVATDIAVGNFDNHREKQSRNPDLQLAVAVGYCQGTNQGVRQYQVKDVTLYDVIDPATNAVRFSKRSTMPIKTEDGTQGKVTRLSITRADLHGRSLRLGGGYKLKVSKTSPTMILAQPPSHADYAFETLSSPAPTLVNLSFAPDRFSAGYSTASSTSSEDSTSETSGWGFSAKESLNQTLTFGSTTSAGLLLSGVEVSATFTAQQDITHANEEKWGTMSTSSQRINSTTGLNDVVWFEDDTTYVYVYDVAGKTVCRGGRDACSDSDKVPLTVMFTAPGAKETHIASGETLEWYQPTWENGNVLSYPGNLKQLMNATDGNPLNDSQSLTTDSSIDSRDTTWAGTQSRALNVSHSSLFQENGELTVEGAGGVKVFGTGATSRTTLSVDIGGSQSFSSLETSSTTITQSTGISMIKEFTSPRTFSYSFTPVIFGQKMPPNYFNGTDPKTPGSGLPPVKTDLNVFGPLRTAFTVDPLNKAGAWWAHNYSQKPDVAINHPNRWDYSRSNVAPLPANCVSTTGSADCATQNPRTPEDPWDDPFHSMRGFFVYKTKEANLNDPTHQGMQQVLATAGDQMLLETRLYNYSTAEMPTGYRVHARFFGMPWNKATMLPPDYVDWQHPGGESFEIGEYVGGTISPFNTDTDIPNYVLASVPFDTTGHENQRLVFWVVTWAENGSGAMMEELPGKGLSSNPGKSQERTLMSFASLEPTVPNEWKTNASDPDVTSFSNNVGFYRQLFYVMAPTSSAEGASGATDSSGDIAKVTVHDVNVVDPWLQPGESTEVNAVVRNDGDPMEILSVELYDGDPEQGGSLFDIDRLPYLEHDETHKVRVRYAPKDCGAHTVFVRVTHEGASTAPAVSEQGIHVDCDASPSDNGSHGGGGCSVTPSASPSIAWLVSFGALAAMARRRRREE